MRLSRAHVVVLGLVVLVACEDRQQRLSSAGPKAVYAAERTDSAVVRARRVWDEAGLPLSVSPDGRRVAYTEWDSGNVVIRELKTGVVSNVTHNAKPYSPGFGMTPRLSRDGKWVAYAWSVEHTFGTQLRIASVDGSEPRIVYDDASAGTGVRAEDWAPDGRTILALRSQEDGTKQIVLVPATGGAVRTLKTLDWREPMRMSFSPDGRFIAYDFPTVEESNAHRDVFVLDLTSGRESRLVAHAANDYLLGWGPDAAHVLFASDRAGTPGAWLQQVRDGSADGAPVLVKPELWNAVAGQFVGAGAFFYGVQTASRQAHLATLDANGKVVGEAVSLTPAPNGRVNDPEWSPDGRSVSYLVGNNGHTASVTLRSIESGAMREIPTPNALGYSYHRWFRDAKSILLSGSPKGNAGFFRLDVRTAKVTPLFMLERGAAVPGYRAFELAPDDRTLAYVKVFRPASGGSRAELLVRDLDTQRERVLYQPSAMRLGLWMAVSPDGARLAFVEGYDKDAKLEVVPLSGGTPERVGGDFVPRGNSPLAWAPDGRALFVVRAGESPDAEAIWRVPIGPGTANATGIVGEQITELRLDPTGRRLVYASGSTKAELWVMEHIVAGETTNGGVGR